METSDPPTSQSDVGQLEDPTKKRQVAGGEDEGNNAEEGGSSRTRLFPLEKTCFSSGTKKKMLVETTHAQKAV